MQPVWLHTTIQYCFLNNFFYFSTIFVVTKCCRSFPRFSLHKHTNKYIWMCMCLYIFESLRNMNCDSNSILTIFQLLLTWRWFVTISMSFPSSFVMVFLCVCFICCCDLACYSFRIRPISIYMYMLSNSSLFPVTLAFIALANIYLWVFVVWCLINMVDSKSWQKGKNNQQNIAKYILVEIML